MTVANKKKIQLLTIFVCFLTAFFIFAYRSFAFDLPRVFLLATTSLLQKTVTKASVTENIGIPIRLKIPAIAVDVAIDKVALAADGSMAVPKLPGNAAWYMLGPKPGEIGSSVIAGHLNWWNGAIGAFENLKDLKVGDIITVQDDNGRDISFAVRESRSYSASADATAVFGLNEGKSHLNLVTCEGVWDKNTQQYSKRLVVFADRVTFDQTTSISAPVLALRAHVKGRILLQVQQNGEAWYVNPTNGLRYYMKDGVTAYAMMRTFGLGITNADLARVKAGDLSLINRLRGRILLQVERNGEAYYIHPDTGVAHYMANGEAAYTLMRLYSLGITDADLLQIPVGVMK